jgi:aspartyl-tRNA synthetase
VDLCGWVAGVRDLGGLMFVDLRDRSGIVQVVAEPDAAEALGVMRGVRHECCVRVGGRVSKRAGGVNRELPTGEVEVRATRFELLSESAVPPFLPEDDVKASEELRLKHRYLDLRRPKMQRMLALRHRVFQAGRRFLSDAGLLEIETPILFKSTPEGARDYLVPSRVSPGTFYALPQSPQILKQVLMVSGCDGYFQMARCFRDEDLRANRQPEFTQMDLEMAFCVEEDVFRVTEGFVRAAWAAAGVEIAAPVRLTHAEAMAQYGSDKPDLRFGMRFEDLTAPLHESAFPVVAKAADRGEVVRGFAVPKGGAFSRKDLDTLTECARAAGAKGLVWIKVASEGAEPFAGPATKQMSLGELETAARTLHAGPGDLMLVVTGRAAVVGAALAACRLWCGDKLALRPRDRFAFAWVRDFPLYERDEKTGTLAPAHHPFCMPREEDLHRLADDPTAVRARTYDLVCNGEELGSGSIRIHRQDVQALVFERLGLSEEEAREKFGFFLHALSMGAPPHGGIALGMDRILMLVAGEDNIRDVLAFPKTASAADLMASAPSAVSDAQLRELRIKLDPPSAARE